jgi:hypothetical protein
MVYLYGFLVFLIMNRKTMGPVDKTKLPGLEALENPGMKSSTIISMDKQ